MLAIPGLPILMLAAALTLPPAPNAPLLYDIETPCMNPDTGFYAHIYDTDPGGTGAVVEYGRWTPSTKQHGAPFLVILVPANATPQSEVKALIQLPGRKMEEWSGAKLKSVYSHPCQIIQQILQSPAEAEK